MKNNPISATIDFDKEGIQHGFLKVPYSSNTSAWGSIMIPITQFKNSDGPTALLTGANHGDEYEGPIALFNLARRNDISNISGRVIIIPAMNFPAFQSCDRVSPIDGINMNRTYPGKPDGTVTQIIADYFSRILLPMTDIALDIHSGGKTLDCLPFAASHVLDNKKQEGACEAASKAFGAPYLLKMLELDSGGMYDSQVESMGKTFVTTELGGGGTSTPYTVEIAKRGVDNLLIHAGIMDGTLIPNLSPTVSLNMPDDRSFVCCEHRGLVEPIVSLGDMVRTGDLLAKIHNTDRTTCEPVEYFAKRDGMVIIKHAPSIVSMGDNLFVIAEVV
ncbi:MAG: N(2)-acetyl-L-2,4-diaminobutanoate deacetylase DoeB [Gammaproteobacteria bacterium]|nr:N(2)-acetyl-L-2,4-diaminobutanoate deacetylase DoeB [Gammaproteobacteria bacterium]